MGCAVSVESSIGNSLRTLAIDLSLFVEEGQSSAGFATEPLTRPDGEQKREAEDDERAEPGNLREPERERGEPVESADMINGGADAVGQEPRTVKDAY